MVIDNETPLLRPLSMRCERLDSILRVEDPHENEHCRPGTSYTMRYKAMGWQTEGLDRDWSAQSFRPVASIHSAGNVGELAALLAGLRLQ